MLFGGIHRIYSITILLEYLVDYLALSSQAIVQKTPKTGQNNNLIEYFGNLNLIFKIR